ncbi:MAG: 6,7-dimethyl-8-ribityllumazine synthase [Planctomycetota bacterium]
MKQIEGRLRAEGRRFALVASRFNGFVVEHLVSGADLALRQLGAKPNDISVFYVPGALEIPPVAQRLAASGRFDAVVCLGAVIRGSTPHFDYVAGECARGVARAGLEAKVPVIFGVLTTDTIEQAIERAGTKAGNKGAEAARAAVELANLFEEIQAEVKTG